MRTWNILSINSASIFIKQVPNLLRQYIALYRHCPSILFKYSMAVVLPDFILICLEPRK